MVGCRLILGALPLLLVALASAESPATARPAPLTITRIAETGDRAPGIEGARISGFVGSPVANATGSVVFTGIGGIGGKTGTLRAWAVRASGERVELLAKGDPVPGSDRGAILGRFDAPRLADDGSALFPAVIADPGNPGKFEADLLVLVRPDGTRASVARAGAPWAPGQAVLADLRGMNLGNGGRFTLLAALRGEGGESAAYFRGDSENGLRMLACEGGVAPGLPDHTVRLLSFEPPAIHSSGAVAFSARVEGRHGEPSSVVYRVEPDGEPVVVARRGDPAGFAGCRIASVDGTLGFTASGAVFFGGIAMDRAPLDGIWVIPHGGKPVPLARTPGDPAAIDPAATDAARVAVVRAEYILAALAGDEGAIVVSGRDANPAPGGDSLTAAWCRDDQGTFRAVFRQGDPAPGLPGRRFSGLPPAVYTCAAGVTVLGAYLESAPGAPDDSGLWIVDPSGTVHLVAAVGGPFTVDGRTRTVAALEVGWGGALSNGCDGQSCPLTSDGRVVFGLDFTEGTGGIYAASLTDDATTLAARFAAVVGAVPEPANAAAFDYRGCALLGGRPVGTYRFAAEPCERSGEKLWKVTDELAAELGGERMAMRSTAVLGGDLSARDGESQLDVEGRVESSLWRRAGAAVRVTRGGNGSERELTLPAGADRALTTTTSALILFCRLVGLAPTSYEVATFNSAPGLALPFSGEETVSSSRIDVRGLADWRGKPAVLVTCDQQGGPSVLAFDARTREFLGARLPELRGLERELLAPGAAADVPPPDALKPPAKTPVEAALIAGLALATSDVALLREIGDWPSIYEASVPEEERGGESLEAFRDECLRGLADLPARQPREFALNFMMMAKSGLFVEMSSDDRATVRFPEIMRLVFTVAKIGKHWWLAALPQKY